MCAHVCVHVQEHLWRSGVDISGFLFCPSPYFCDRLMLVSFNCGLDTQSRRRRGSLDWGVAQIRLACGWAWLLIGIVGPSPQLAVPFPGREVLDYVRKPGNHESASEPAKPCVSVASTLMAHRTLAQWNKPCKSFLASVLSLEQRISMKVRAHWYIRHWGSGISWFPASQS